MLKLKSWLAAMGALGLAAAPMAAAAQSPEEAAERAEARIERRQLIEPGDTTFRATGDVATAAKQTVTIRAALPVTYNSNPTSATSDADGAIHAAPSLGLDFRSTSATGVFKATLSGDMDEYFSDAGDDASSLLFSTGYEATNLFGKVTPYVGYDLLEICGGEFKACDLTLHTISGGAKRAFDLTPGEPNDKAKTILTVNGSISRRESNNTLVEQNRANFTIAVGGPIRNAGELVAGAAWQLKQSITMVNYTGGTNEGRDDVNAKTTLGVEYALGKYGALGFAVQLQFNESDRPDKDYHVWDLGPAVSLKRAF